MVSEKIKLLCISRRYYPSLGGMSQFCTEIFPRIDKEKFEVKILVLGKSQINLLWFFPYTIFYMLLYAKKYNAIFVGDLLMCFVGYVCHLAAPNTKRLVAVHGLDITYSNKLYQWYIKKISSKSFDSYVCNSDATKKLLADIGIDKTLTIPSGVNIHRYKNIVKNKDDFFEKNGLNKKSTVLMTAGRLVKRKGVEWFILNVLPKLSLEVVYFIIGDGVEIHNIERAINKKNLKNKVKIISNASDSLLNYYYCHADLFIMPNLKVINDMEGFGLVAIEASLAGAIVIASDVDGISTAIKDGKNGYLVQGENSKAFVNKIEDVCQNYNIEFLSEKFSEFTKNNFDWELVCEKYENALINVL